MTIPVKSAIDADIKDICRSGTIIWLGKESFSDGDCVNCLPKVHAPGTPIYASVKLNDGHIRGGYVPRGFRRELQNRLNAAKITYTGLEIDYATAVMSLMASSSDGANEYGEFNDGTAVIIKPIAHKLLKRMSAERVQHTRIMKWLTSPSPDGKEALLILYKDYSNCSRHASCYDKAHGCGHPRYYYVSDVLSKRAWEFVDFDYSYLVSSQPNYMSDDDLSRYILASFPHLTLPSLKQVEEMAVRLNGSLLKTSSGIRRAVYLHEDHKGEAYWVERDARALTKGKPRIRFLDSDIAAYENMLHNGITLPHTSPKCPRVFNGITSMRAWIRNLILVDDEETVSLDYKALHPNLMYKILKDRLPMAERRFYEDELAYDPVTDKRGDVHSGCARYIVAHAKDRDLEASHPKLAIMARKAVKDGDLSSIRTAVKRDHLAYFNTHHYLMGSMAVDYVYSKAMPTFVEEVKRLKRGSDGHYATSSVLFHHEVELMRVVAKKLHLAGIYGIYAYDCIAVAKSRAAEARELMQETARHYGVDTYVDSE